METGHASLCKTTASPAHSPVGREREERGTLKSPACMSQTSDLGEEREQETEGTERLSDYTTSGMKRGQRGEEKKAPCCGGEG